MNRKNIKETFSYRAKNYDHESTWVRDKTIIELFAPKPFGDRTLIDLCSGTGSISKFAVGMGWDVTTVDISEPMLSQIYDMRIKKLKCDVENLPFKDNEFDLATCRQGLQYLNLPKALTEFARVTKSEIRIGHITLEEPEDEVWWRQYFELASPGRLHVFHPNQVGELCKKCGFVITQKSVFRTHGSFNGPIQYLEEGKKQKIYKLLEDTSPKFKKRYNMTPINGNDIEYSHRWEFYVLKIK